MPTHTAQASSQAGPGSRSLLRLPPSPHARHWLLHLQPRRLHSQPVGAVGVVCFGFLLRTTVLAYLQLLQRPIRAC